MKLVLVGIDPDHVRFTAAVPIRFHWAIGDIVMPIIVLRNSRKPGYFFIIQHWKWNWFRLGSIPTILVILLTTFPLIYSIS